MDNGPEALDRAEVEAVRAQARRVRIRSIVGALILTLLAVTAP